MKIKRKKDNYLVKGEYTHPQVSGCFTARQFILTEQDGKHCLLLRFENELRVPITEAEITVTQLDFKGRELGEPIDVRYQDIDVKPKGKFCTPRGIVVDSACADCIVRVKYVICENVKYEIKNGYIVGYYDKRGYANVRKKLTRDLYGGNLKVRRKYAGGGRFYGLVAFVSALLVAFALFFVKSQLENAGKDDNFRTSRKQSAFATDILPDGSESTENI